MLTQGDGSVVLTQGDGSVVLYCCVVSRPSKPLQ